MSVHIYFSIFLYFSKTVLMSGLGIFPHMTKDDVKPNSKLFLKQQQQTYQRKLIKEQSDGHD